MKENLGNACNNAIYMRPAEFTCERRRDVTTDIYVAPYFSRFLRGVPRYISRRRRYVSGASRQMDSHFSPLSIWLSLGKLGSTLKGGQLLRKNRATLVIFVWDFEIRKVSNELKGKHAKGDMLILSCNDALILT